MGLRTSWAPGLFPCPAPLNGPGWGVFFGIPGPCPGSGSRPTHTPAWFLFKIYGNKRGPFQAMSTGTHDGGGARITRNIVPWPRVRVWSGEWQHTQLRPVTNTNGSITPPSDSCSQWSKGSSVGDDASMAVWEGFSRMKKVRIKNQTGNQVW